MPIDFRTYTDPGVYIEAITPPVVFTAAIEPTILAIVGEAPASRSVTESMVLSTTSASTLNTLGADVESVNTIDRLLGTQYVSAAVGVLVVDRTNVQTSWTVTTFSTVILPTAPFSIIVEDEELLVTVGPAGTSQAWTVTRAQNATTGVAHLAGQVINLAEGYSDNGSLDVAVLAAPVSATAESFLATERPKVQRITLTGFDGGATDGFTLTYNAVATTAIGSGGATYTSAHIKAALEALVAIVTVNVYDLSGRGENAAASPGNAGFIVEFVDPDPPVATLLTVAQTAGSVSGVATDGVANSTYLDVEGERMLVTGVSGTAPQTVNVTRGVNGTTAKAHGAVELYQNTGADYTVRLGAGEDGVIGTNDDTLSLLILEDLRISDGSPVSVTFTTTDAAQFSAALFNDLDTIREKYGDPLDSNGQLLSELTLGAQLALANGATQLVLVAANPDDAHPIQDAIDKLQLEQNVNVLVALSGVSADISYAKGHVDALANQGLLRRAFVGLDGLSSPAPTSADFVSKAQTLHDERVTLVAPGQFKLNNATDTPLIIAGYFGAAAVAGIHAGLDPQEPLTRKQVFGFVGINDQDTQTNIFTMQSKGVLVVFEDRLGRLIIKHGLTTNMDTTYTREISVVAARDRLQDFILETLDGGALIGSAMTSDTPSLVMAAVNSALEESVRQHLIADYADVKFRIPSDNQTLIEVRFSYKPTLPLNYVHVQFSIDTSSATVEFQSVNESA